MHRILIVIQYDVTIGYAVGRNARTFYEMGTRATGSADAVHFAFARLGPGHNPYLPHGFDNLLEFDVAAADAGQMARLTTYIRKHQIDTIFAYDLHPHARYLGPARRAGVKTVVSYYGAPLSSVNSGLKLLLKRLEMRLLWPSKPDLFILQSEAMRRTATHGRGIARSRTLVVPTGFDVAMFKPLPDAAGEIYRRFDIPRERRIVAYMGHLHRRKGVHVLLAAANQIVSTRRRTDVHFVFLGNRPGEVEGFGDCYDAKTTGTHITFAGYQDKVPELLAGCYIGCIPTTGWDSFPRSPSEMQACGIPVVVTDCQGLPETVDPEVTGLVVPAGNVGRLSDALLLLLDDPARREVMSKAALARIHRHYTVDAQIEKLTDALRMLWQNQVPHGQMAS